MIDAVAMLKKHRTKLSRELDKVDAALAALHGRRRKHHTMSREAREKIAAAQRKRWRLAKRG